MDFVCRDQLVAAMNAWVLEKQTPLEEIFQRHGALDRSTRELLEALAAKHLAVHDNNAEKSLQAISSVGSIRDELRSIADREVERSLCHLMARSDTSGTPTISVGVSTSSGQRFQILRPHGRGGLGEVYVALDTELNREVALKEINSSHCDSTESRARFTLEAEITGGLEHPGIVPVYGLGSYGDGRPYYAMRFIRGHTLSEAIAQFHRPDRNFVPGERSLEVRKLLSRFVDVCNAIEYAHSRGVLHRDLKPSNIMLGKYGETLVVDWGLAKAVGKRDLLIDEPTLRPRSGSGSTATQMGTALGTPAYMSPEQAAGRLDELGPASDVYSLGATLYCLLTGDSPYPKSDDQHLGELLRKVQTGDFEHPRSRKPAIPRPLEAICLKAMALKPSDRYATPARLAEDIEHWLADEAVSATTETLVERSARFVRKHKSGAMATAAALVIVAVISTVAAVVINQQRAEKSQLANDMQIEAAKSAFEHALGEYDHGHVGSADQYFARALALLPEHALRESYQRIAWDRATRGGRSLLPPLRHQDAVNFAQFSPDGKRIVTASLDFTARIWDADTGAALGEPMRHENSIYSAQFSSDGKRVVTTSRDKTARVWNAVTGEPLSEPMRHEDRVVFAQFSPDGTSVVTASHDKSARVWDADAGTLLGEPLQHQEPVQFAQFSPDGTSVVTASHDKTARIWDAATSTPRGEPMRHGGAVQFAQFNSVGKRVITASSDGTARVWDADTGAPLGEPIRH
jgi:WD40 repeat protein/serine/threonine protein kinase